ncbi:TetR/AcrR family transcriptional regulator [Paenibacillus sediminis]|uniref:AcrR family transcriptional regulator n=1 Tax=Paenibacillus sediminis TaxID=664909 RepID=A0ABS4GYD9_9BACL|nr:TetR/AcrR family transcriptional regulator [Paenibacillus sediminis]MBP1935278.1 AcrR family transcriptional regulator [Paenibacillus sediminis]
MSPKVSDAYKEEKRASILAGALHCFTEKGFQATTVEDIVRHLGISKGAIYSYFSSKEDMYIQMADDRMNAMVESLSAQFKDITSAADKIRFLFDRFQKQPLHELRKWLTFHMEFMLYAARQPELIDYFSKYSSKALSLVQKIIEDGKKSGECRADLDETAAPYLFWAVRDGLALQFMLYGEEADYRSILKDMENMVLRYILKSPPN